MKKINAILRYLIAPNLSPQDKAVKAYSPPYPKSEHRFSYKVDIIPVNNPYKADFPKKHSIGGHYINSKNPIKARAIAFRKAAELPYDPALCKYGKFSARIWFVDEREEESYLIHDMAAKPTAEVCENLEYEYELLNRLGFEITDWEVLTAPDGKAFRVIRSELHIMDICPDHIKPIIATDNGSVGKIIE